MWRHGLDGTDDLPVWMDLHLFKRILLAVFAWSSNHCAGWGRYDHHNCHRR